MQLAGGQLAVADHGVGAGGGDDVAELVGLARADVGGRVGLVAALASAPSSTCEPAVSASAASSASERSASACGALGPHADQHDALQAQLPVLDLGDVGELGGEAGDAAQRAALLEDVGPGGVVGLVETATGRLGGLAVVIVSSVARPSDWGT